MPFGGTGARGVEAPLQLRVDCGAIGIRPQALPLAARAVDLVERFLGAGRARGARRAPRASGSGLRAAPRLRGAPLLHGRGGRSRCVPAPRARQSARPSRLSSSNVPSPVTARHSSSASASCASRAFDRGIRRDGLDARDHRCDPLLPLLERCAPRRLLLVHRLDDRARAPATPLLFARLATPSSTSRTSSPPAPASRARSRAATPASLCSVLTAMFRSSAPSAMRATASGAVCGSAAWRATLPSSFGSWMRPSAAARTVSCGEDLRDGREMLLVVDPFERERRRSRRSQPARYAIATRRSTYAATQLLVALGAGELDHVFDGREPGAGGPPHARVGIVARELAQHGRCSSSRGISATAAALTAGSACFQRGCGLKRSRKDMEEPYNRLIA